jgi:hypothetical protein
MQGMHKKYEKCQDIFLLTTSSHFDGVSSIIASLQYQVTVTIRISVATELHNSFPIDRTFMVTHTVLSSW